MLRKFDFVALIVLTVSVLSINMTPLGLGVIENGWKFYGENPAELAYISNSSLGVLLTSDFDKYDFDIYYMDSNENNPLKGFLSFGKHIYGEKGFFSINYTIAKKEENISWGIGLKILYAEDSSTGSGNLSFGVDGRYGRVRYGIAIKDLCLYSQTDDLSKSLKIGAAIGFIINNMALLNFEASLFNYDAASGYANLALDFRSIAVGIKGGGMYNFSNSKYSFDYGIGGLFNMGSLRIGLTFSQSFGDIDLPEILRKYNSPYFITFNVNMTL